jgi:hypothetical protein
VQRSEQPNNTDLQVEEYVTKALLLVSELDPDGDLRAVVFEQACALYAGKQIVMTQPETLNLANLRPPLGSR